MFRTSISRSEKIQKFVKNFGPAYRGAEPAYRGAEPAYRGAVWVLHTF